MELSIKTLKRTFPLLTESNYGSVQQPVQTALWTCTQKQNSHANTEPGVHYIHTHALPFGHVCLWWKKHTYCGCSPDKPTRTLTAWRLRTHRLTNQVQSAYKGTIQQCFFPFQPSFYSFSILHTTMLPMQFGYVMLLTPVYRSLLTTVAVRQWFLYSAMRCGVGVTLRERRAAWQVKRLHWE